MIPKKPEELIAFHAQVEGLPEEDIRCMVSGYFSAIKEAMKDLRHPMISLPYVGDFRMSSGQIDKAIMKERRLIDTPNTTYPKDGHIENLDRLYKARKMKDKELERCKQILDLKRRYWADKNQENELEGDTTAGLE